METPKEAPKQPSQSPVYKRHLRNFLIHKPLQREYTLLMISIMMASTMTTGYVIHHTMKEAMFGDLYHIGKISPYEALAYVNQRLIYRISVILLAGVILATAIGIVFLHRVAGPVYRFQGLLRRLVKNEIPHDVHLRDKDYFKEVAHEFNDLFKLLREKKILAQQLAQDIARIPTDSLPPAGRETLNQIKQSLEKF